ncbi:LysE family transporter [Shewanella nanhaiensis]|uniref:LysE family transporter n=1 Tax=Shewanella nanhaiensis TaxID=2864872 RepID=A0ABS7E855_9GAMM|nr:LysE family transporter [Shewanella nanhaiensis]MBW8185879.1 LysE family transporter [Shewanella nanhaiensis]
MDLSLLLSLAIIHSLALASPGPDFALVVKMASQESRTTALAAAFGISFAILFHTLLSLTGVSLIIKSSENLFFTVQLFGAGYLAWIGLTALKEARLSWKAQGSVIALEENSANLTPAKGFKQGFYTNLLNPKAMVFFITLFSVMITPEVNLATKVCAAGIILILSIAWFSAIALVLSKPVIQQKIKKATPVINLLTGILFLTVAVAIISGLFKT